MKPMPYATGSLRYFRDALHTHRNLFEDFLPLKFGKKQNPFDLCLKISALLILNSSTCWDLISALLAQGERKP